MTAYPPLTGAEPCRQVPPDVFFPESGDNAGAAAAAALCTGCDLLLPCLAWAVANEKHGVWGGATPKQRAQLRQLNQRKAAA